VETYLNQLLPSLANFHYLVYWLAFFAALFETTFLLGLFLPGSTLLLLLGAYAAGGHIDIIDLWWFALAGAILGDNVNYYLGKRYGKQWTRDGIWVVTPEHFVVAHGFFEKHGSKSVFLGRFVPTVKEIIPFVAGTVEMNHRNFMLWNVLGAMGWGLQWLGAGYIFAQSLSLAQLWMSRIGMLAVAVLLVFLLLWMLQHLVITHGRVVFEFILSIWQSIYAAVQANEKVQTWKVNHPRMSAFFRRRFDRTRFRGRTLTLLSIAFFYVLVLFAGIVEDLINSDVIVALDKSIAQLVSAFRAPEVLQLFIRITELGNWQVALPVTFFAALFFITVKRWKLIIPMLISVLGSECFTLLGKMAFHRPRPVEAVLYEHSYSFPSGHATIAAALYGFLGYLAIRHVSRWQMKVKLFFLTLIVIGLLGLSRIMVGVHYLSDVWAGYLVGTLWLIIAISLTEWLAAQKNLYFHTPVPAKRKLIGAGLLVLTLFYYVGFTIVYQPRFAPVKQLPTVQLTWGLPELLTTKNLQFTQTIFGSRQQPVSVEIVAKNDQTLLDHLHRAGWKNAADPDIHTVFRQLQHTPEKSRIPVAPAFWNGEINKFALVLPQDDGSEFTILYLWKTRYRIDAASVFVGITRTYVGKKWLLLHTIQPDVDASRDNLLQSLQQTDMIQQHCTEKFVPEMTGEYLLNDHFFTRGKLLKMSMLSEPLKNPVFCLPGEE